MTPGPRPGRSEMARFAVTGAAAYGVDVAVFNVAVLTAMPSMAAKALSSVVALVVAYLGNRYVTWPHGPRGGSRRRVASFLVISAAGAMVQLGALWASRHVLGLTSVLADNIAANVVGMAGATCLRFWGFRRFVFVGVPGQAVRPGATGSRRCHRGRRTSPACLPTSSRGHPRPSTGHPAARPARRPAPVAEVSPREPAPAPAPR